MEGGATEQDLDNEPKIEEEFDKFFDMPTSSQQRRKTSLPKKSQGHRAKVFNHEEGKEEKLAHGTETKNTFLVYLICVCLCVRQCKNGLLGLYLNLTMQTSLFKFNQKN